MRKNASSQEKKDRCGARILIELRNKQPLTKDEILERTGISRSAFYDGIRFLKDVKWREGAQGVLKETTKEVEEEGVTKIAYAFYDYIGLEEIFEKLKRTKSSGLTFSEIAVLVGKKPFDIEDQLYKLAKKYDCVVKDGKVMSSSRMRNLKEVFGQ